MIFHSRGTLWGPTLSHSSVRRYTVGLLTFHPTSVVVEQVLVLLLPSSSANFCLKCSECSFIFLLNLLTLDQDVVALGGGVPLQVLCPLIRDGVAKQGAAVVELPDRSRLVAIRERPQARVYTRAPSPSSSQTRWRSPAWLAEGCPAWVPSPGSGR